MNFGLNSLSEGGVLKSPIIIVSGPMWHFIPITVCVMKLEMPRIGCKYVCIFTVAVSSHELLLWLICGVLCLDNFVLASGLSYSSASLFSASVGLTDWLPSFDLGLWFYVSLNKTNSLTLLCDVLSLHLFIVDSNLFTFKVINKSCLLIPVILLVIFLAVRLFVLFFPFH